MGVFAVIGLVVGLIGLSRRSAAIGLLGLVLFAIGVAGDSNGY